MNTGFNFRISIASLGLLVALTLHFFVSIALPSPFYVVETSFNSNGNNTVANGNLQQLTQIRLGIWGACYYSLNGSSCFKTSPYIVTVKYNKSQITVVESSWTGGLPLQVFGTGFTLIALSLSHFLFRRYPYATMATLAAVVLAASASALALLIDLVLFGLVKSRMNNLGSGAGASTNVGPGFWMTLISFGLLVFVFWRLFSMKDKPFEDKDAEEDPKELDEASTPDPSQQLQAYPYLTSPYPVPVSTPNPFSRFPKFPPHTVPQHTVAQQVLPHTVLPSQSPNTPIYVYTADPQGLPRPEQTTSQPQSINSVGLQHVELNPGSQNQTSQVIPPPAYYDGLPHQ